MEVAGALAIQAQTGDPALNPAPLDPDAQWMLLVRDGDDRAFARLVERHRTPLMRFLYRMVLNQAAAEDLAQEAFLRVYRSRSSYQPTAKFSTWLYRIATHLALNKLRDQKKEKDHRSLNPVGLDEETPESAAIERQVADPALSVEVQLVTQAAIDQRAREIRQAIDALPDNQRAAVLLHKYQGLGYVQIAAALDVSESATKSLLFRAYQTLRVRLAHLA